ELRVPFLDRELLSVALKLPAKHRISSKQTKVALRKAAIQDIPSKTANKRKLGFPSPLSVWIREDKYYRMMKSKFESATAEQFFVQREIMRLLDEHRVGTRSNMQQIWSIYCFIVWYEQYFGTDES